MPIFSRPGASSHSKVSETQPLSAAERHGLFILHLPQPSNQTDTLEEEIIVDIVAIHGLGGHPYKTWTDKNNGVNWLRDLLPKQIPNSRIMTFGYAADIAFTRSISGVKEFAHSLLDKLKSSRSSSREKKRPVIFVCHGLGGIVCKKAIIIAHEVPFYIDILKHVRGILFMGTPHRGSRAADFASILASVFRACTPGLRPDLLKTIKTNSEELADISRSFKYRSVNFKIVTFFEQKTMKGLGTLVVSQDSAVLGLPNERTIPVNADHREMARFSMLSNQRFQSVWHAVQDIMEGE
ncbi:hypothetical protein EDC01DRAFT_669267 [Geopyxis carbonaria]|nr:hypothetical protein EDC01DRAFT_669267 [Geopyxis carbonaria]